MAPTHFPGVLLRPTRTTLQYRIKKTEAIFHFCLYDPDGTRPRVTAVKGRCLNRLTTGPMAPQVGLEPTTDRLTADSSTTELLWNNNTLPGNVLLLRNVSPTTIGAKELNFCVRHGNRCDLLAIVTRQYHV